MKNKHINIPVFIPEVACPNRCVFCNQHKISGQLFAPDTSEVVNTIETYLSTATPGTAVHIAFFGGNFTGIAIADQKLYLDIATKYILQKRVHGIRISTRPDYITPEVISLLKNYQIAEIELGMQSSDEQVLKASGRGHTVKDVYRAVELLKEAAIPFGLQMMIGLPSDTREKALNTAKEIVALGAVSTRIYPCLVIKETVLATLYEKGKYHPLTIEESVIWGKDVLRYFIEHDVQVLRVGLHASADLRAGTDVLAGPFHPAIKEMMLSAVWNDVLGDLSEHTHHQRILLEVPEGQLNYATGFRSVNKARLLQHFSDVKIKESNSLSKFHYRVGAIDCEYSEGI